MTGPKARFAGAGVNVPARTEFREAARKTVAARLGGAGDMSAKDTLAAVEGLARQYEDHWPHTAMSSDLIHDAAGSQEIAMICARPTPETPEERAIRMDGVVDLARRIGDDKRMVECQAPRRYKQDFERGMLAKLAGDSTRSDWRLLALSVAVLIGLWWWAL